MSEKGSYQVSSLPSRQEELARLRSQAEKLYPMESHLLKNWAGLKSQDRVLEVGCGPGFLTPLLCELASEGSVTACDTSEELIQICKSQALKTPKLGFQAVLSDSKQIPVANQSQDFSYLRFVLQHAPERISLLKEVSRTLVDQGTLCILDSDDGLTVHFPEDQFVTNLVKNAQTEQNKKGGDRFVGRKLASYLFDLGYQDVKTKIINFTSLDLPFSLLAQISLGFKSQLTGQQKELGQWIQEKKSLAESGQYFFTVGVVLTSGKKGISK